MEQTLSAARSLKGLFVEDSEDDCLLTVDFLQEHGFQVHFRRVCAAHETREALAAEPWEIIFSDCYMPGFDALEALRIYKASKLDIPFIIISGSIGEDIAVEAMRCGAHDYFLKDNLARLPVAIERELREAENRRLKRQAEEERAQQSEELAKRAEQLYRSNKDLERFAYLAAHDLQEPLRTVRLYAGLLAKKRTTNDPELDRIIRVIETNAGRMQGLVEGLLDYSRVTHHPDMHFSEVDTNEVLRRVLEELETLLKETSAVITYDPLPPVTADPVQLGQIFSNLITNAIKYRKPGRVPTIHIAAEQRSEETVISVQDDGIGIAPAFHERIFEIFRRLHREAYPGNGVGLALTKRIVENHDGGIWVQSEPDQGATFFFSLPRRSNEESKPF